MTTLHDADADNGSCDNDDDDDDEQDNHLMGMGEIASQDPSSIHGLVSDALLVHLIKRSIL